MTVVLALLGLLVGGLALWAWTLRRPVPATAAAPRAGLPPPPTAAPKAAIDVEVEEIIRLDTAEGRRRAAELAKLGTIVDRHPEAVAGLIRRWVKENR